MKRIIFAVPKWHLYLGRRARDLPPAQADDPPHLQLGDEIFERLFAGDGDDRQEARRFGRGGRDRVSLWTRLGLAAA